MCSCKFEQLLSTVLLIDKDNRKTTIAIVIEFTHFMIIPKLTILSIITTINIDVRFFRLQMCFVSPFIQTTYATQQQKPNNPIEK